MLIAIFLLLAATVHAAINGACSVGSTPGVCLHTADCTRGGGKYSSGYCPNDPEDIKCCTKTSCGSSGGNCRWTSTCSGTTVANLCPGPSGFKCCQSSIPTIPTSNCKAHVITAGYKILNQFPGSVHTVWCYAPGTSGEHPKGLALDLMIKNRSPIGVTMAEWIMNNHASLKVQYVIFGQKIWNVDIDKTPKRWASWRAMLDAGDDTKNHWDHNHVSFKPA